MNTRWIKYAESSLAILLTAVALFLLVFRLTHAGALWRDEAAAVQLATMPTVHDVAANFQHEAFPLPFPLTLRLYSKLFGETDSGLRCFGFFIAIAMLAVGWFNSRRLGGAGPIVFLALFGLNNLFVMWGSSIRGYGLGSLFVLFTLGLSAKAVRDPTPQNAIAATITASASVQFLINSLPLLAAIAAAAFFVFISDRKWREAGMVCLCALVPVLSFLPYAASYFGSDWNVVLKFPITFAWMWTKFQRAIAGQHQIEGLIWLSAAAFLFASGVWFARRRDSEDLNKSRTVRFALAFVILAIVAYGAFLRILSYPTQSWYYLPLVCAVAGGLDLAVTLLQPIFAMRIARLSVAALFLILAPLNLHELSLPFTNIDFVARTLEANADPADLIVVNPFHFGPSFYRYYHGTTPWITSPTISEHRIHRYDLMKAKMMESDPLADVRTAIRETLQNDHRVWIVGGAHPPEEGLPPALGPPPHPQLGWNGYMVFWSIELGTFLRDHVVDGQVAIDRPEEPINIENVPVLVARGWRY